MKKRKKWLLTSIALLATSVGLALPTKTAFAAKYGKPYKAVVLWEHKIYWYSSYRPSWITHKSHPEWLSPGQKVTITRYPGMGTMVVGKGRRHISNIDKETFWLTPSLSQDWYATYQKYYYLDSGLFSSSGNYTNLAYRIPWNTLCKMAKHGAFYVNLADKRAVAKNLRYIKSLHLVTYKIAKDGTMNRIK